ncbi:MAG: hypothetical protein HQ538_05120 [Parcubacteria group bacterium]|nr:hypothetical protein [Parcubacteria group bacterium]
MFTFWGIGTTLYGKTDIQSDDSYIVTKWFIFLLLPIIPLASYRVYSKSNSNPLNPAFLLIGAIGSKQKFTLREVKLNKEQIRRTYLVAYGLLIGFGLIIYAIT